MALGHGNLQIGGILRHFLRPDRFFFVPFDFFFVPFDLFVIFVFPRR